QWNPQVLVDAHEMGPLDTYLFSPPREPFHPSVTKTLKKWWDIFARDQAQSFDRYGWSYYTREWMEMWYPGYANSWILYTGGLGILYEQAGVQGSCVRQKDGKVLTYRESVHHHLVSSMANLKTAAENREELLRDFYKEKKRAIEGGKTNAIQTFLFVPGRNKTRADKLVQTLISQGIEVEKAKDDFIVGKVTDFWGKSFLQKKFPEGTYLVRLDQPLRPLIQAILEFDPRMSQSFLEEERHELEKRKKTRLYEVSAWSVPMAYNVETYWTKNKVIARTNKVAQVRPPEGKVVNPHPKYGYLLDYSDDKAVNALAYLLSAEGGSFGQEGFKVRVGEKPFKIEGMEFSRGSILLRNSENPLSLHDLVNRMAQEMGVTVYGINTALSEEGPDLGGQRFKLLERPRTGLFAGPPIDFTSYGSIWHLLDQILGIRCSSLDINGLNRTNLDKYNLLILPAVWGAPEAYTHVIGKSGIERLRKWIESGGTFIAIGTGAAFAADTTVKLSQVRLRRQVLDKLTEYEEAVSLEEEAEKPLVDSSMTWGYPPNKKEKPKESKKTEEKDKENKELEKLKRKDERLRLFKPRGVILRADLDREHWLTSGICPGSVGDDKVPVILHTDFAFMSKSPVQTPARLSGADSLRLSGLLWLEARERWAKTAYLTRESLGKGQVILFTFQPDFRGYFHGSERLLINALLFGPGLGTTRPAPW
ncbi:MAG: M14 family metallopeptidase, partial [Candidatus Zixiibacteriota bacterium]